MPTLYLFADSNLFLHYKPLHQIEWSQIGGFDDVEVVVCRTVQREIDALKDGREGRRTDRARRAASIFLEIAQNGPQERRAASPHVVLSLYGTSQPKADLGEQLDYSQNDDRIIGHLAQFREENPLADARLLTRDSGPVLTARSLGIPCVVIPDEWRLASEPDDRERNIQELTRQLQELQAQEPGFHFSCEQQSDERPAHVEIVYEAFQPLTKTERDKLLERLLDLYPPSVVNRTRISAQDIADYEERDHPAWIAECEKYMKLVNIVVQLERCPELTMTIQNTGSRPATNVLVDIRASGNFGLTAPMTELRNYRLIPVMERPKPPAQPEPPRGLSAMINDINRLDRLTHHDLSFSPHFQDQEDFEYTAEPKLETAPSISLKCGLWRHSLEPKDFTVRLVPPHNESRITGQITCTVHADNLTKPATFKLVVTLSPEHSPILDPAIQWFTSPHPNERDE